MFSSSDESDFEDYYRGRRPRIFRERINFELMSYHSFNEKFRISFSVCEELLRYIGPSLEHETNRNHALSAKQQILIGLHWLGNGGQYHGVADMHGVSKATVCRVVKKVVNAINERVFPDKVKWPRNTADVVEKFYSIAGMPNVAGCIDGTLIKIDAPREHEDRFVDRHGNHSINCMLVCGPDLNFYYVSARWPGKVHDARVLRNSELFSKMNSGWRPHPRSILLGDSGYGCTDWLITPKNNITNDEAVQRFNRAHKSTRRLIENAFGVLKEKFPCLQKLRVNPIYACNIVKACATICNLTSNTLSEIGSENDEEDDNSSREEIEPDTQSGLTRRDEIINLFRQ
ncbi:putative nuclease HARBI1 [Episyrphus balteatus]|uniref:putative nuclease HARBI1 n=1 Tax=Episyrphus balteatus TaxID=286459 RepID=UPI0024859207|nr:putative nuclease HARBI1 [Episyrphus balteatus]